MSNVKKFLDDLKQVKTTLNKVGINTHVLPNISKGPESIEFSMGLATDRKSIEFYFEDFTDDNNPSEIFNSRLKVLHTSKKFRQAVLQLKEEKRTITRRISLGFKSGKPTKKRIEDLRAQTNLAWRFPIQLPAATQYEAEYLKEASDKAAEFIFEVTANAPASTQYFLVGYDESHMFISCLPRAVKTVEEAHSCLMPASVKRAKGVIRQGEFYFVPLTQRELKILEKEDLNVFTSNDYLWLDDGNGETDHQVSLSICLHLGKKSNKLTQVVTGFVQNDRHFTLLNGLYKVIPNLEIPNPTDANWD